MTATKRPILEMVKLGAILALYAAASCAVLAVVKKRFCRSG